jgi:subtilisin family serine protease
VDGDNEPQPGPLDSHGTACAGIIGAASNNGRGTAGIAWHCRILPIRILGEGGFADTSAIADAFSCAVDQGAKVISNSWGGPFASNQIIDAIDTAVDRGCLVVVSAGNGGASSLEPMRQVGYPARYERCIAVGSVGRDDLLFGYSSRGPGYAVDLVAPSGECNLEGDIWTTDHSGENGYNQGDAGAEEASGDYTGHFGGTSAAAPVVAGVAALVWSTYPNLTAEQIREILEDTAVQVDPEGGQWVGRRSKLYGFGKVNALAALERARAVEEDP